MSEEAFKAAKELYDTLEGSKVIKPTKQAYQSFIKLHSLTLDKAKQGAQYKILGTTFTVVRNLDYNREGSNKWFPIIKYFDKDSNRYEEYGIIQTDNFAAGVLETCFKNQTGILLYF